MDKENSYNRCVYTEPEGLCPGSSLLHPKEHFLPAGLGNFKGDVRLKNFICYDCQHRFSKCEEVFLRNSAEAFFRRILGVQGRKSHKSKNIFVEPTLGLAPLTIKGAHPTLPHELLWEMKSQTEAFPMNQLVFKKPDGTLEHIPIREGKLLQDLSRFGDHWKAWQLVVCLSTAAHEDELQAVLGPALGKMKDDQTDIPGKAELEGEMRTQISQPYVQTLCKIAFHFVLAHFHFTGFESEFADLKRFIYSGTGTNRARIVKEILLPQLAPNEARLRHWSHVVTAEFNPQGFISRMQFFAGPRLKPFVWRVDMGQNPSRVVSEMAKGLRFFYYEQPDPSGYDGGIEQLGLGPRMWSRS